MIKVVCAVFLKPGHTVLACQRPLDKSEGGKWEFPGGRVESGETSQEALKREILEELGAIILVGEALTPVTHGQIILQPFRAEIPEGSIALHEHLDARWVALAEADQLNWAAADLPILEELKSIKKAE